MTSQFNEEFELNNDHLQELSTLVAELKLVEAEIEEAEAAVSKLKQRKWRLETDSIPAMMQEMGYEDLKVRGRRLTLKLEYSVRIAQKNEQEAFTWLAANGHEGIIKRFEKVQVHPQTLKAWIREQFEAGQGAAIPDVFNPFAGTKVVIKDE